MELELKTKEKRGLLWITAGRIRPDVHCRSKAVFGVTKDHVR
jgi:hypothetical protein